MGEGRLHLIKLCVGIGSVEELVAWRRPRYRPGESNRHVTRMFPRRADELLRGGSLYWVMGGLVQARQRILRLDPVTGEDGIRRCAIILDPHLVRTRAAPRRPFQGWRYLKAEDAPRDLPEAARRDDDALPPEMARALADIGLV